MGPDEARARAESAKRAAGLAEPLRQGHYESATAYAFLLDMAMDAPVVTVDRASGAIGFAFGPGVPFALDGTTPVGVSPES